jgi:hypothetical protein
MHIEQFAAAALTEEHSARNLTSMYVAMPQQHILNPSQYVSDTAYAWCTVFPRQKIGASFNKRYISSECSRYRSAGVVFHYFVTSMSHASQHTFFVLIYMYWEGCCLSKFHHRCVLAILSLATVKPNPLRLLKI